MTKFQQLSYKFTFVLFLGILNFSYAQKKVIGYIPNWIDLNTFSNSIQYNKLTHINIAFENPDANGNLSFQSGNNAIIQAAHANNVKVFVSIGGGAISEGGAIRDNFFNQISAGNRASFVQKLKNYVIAHNFDGLDVDLEGPAINGDYGSFITDLAASLHANNKQITAALSQGYGGANVPSYTFSSFDWINIMAYDATGPWNPSSPGQHSPYSLAVQQFNYWTGRGLPASKAIIGLPFYGYGFGSSANQGISYADIVATYPGSENVDQVANTIYYNGIPTIKQKTTFAIQNAGGVMIWQLAQDAVGPKSLLSAINDVINGTQPPQNGVATVYKHCNYDGYAVNLSIGNYTWSQLQAKGVLDNDISSLKVQSGYEMVLYANDNFTGTSIIINANNACLVANSFNDVATSVRVRAITNSSSILIQAENYSNMNGIQTEPTTDSGGGLNVGYADTGDWMAYNSITFPTTGSYLIEYRVASAVSGAVISSDLNGGSIILGNVNIPNTGAWQNWQTISQTVNVNTGTYNFGIYIQNSGVNLNWIRITKVSNAFFKQVVSEEKESILVYPNPVENSLNFSMALKSVKTQIIDFQRGIYLELPIVNDKTLDVSTLTPGIYAVVFEIDGKTITKKFVKK
ncbi:carbohydrate-binding protein [Flavobacterium jejuense]|uniref:chitinase n=1 Tax=Flavobacterium jejuense TaxID=1544455 RepID=A0ABX0INK5_9FLAO|nr:glycosyl hydrolase family 18 protein [Flavobacterium jejuense]NHN24811.1 carbohydrate-binding protein [Flavobacterium jejuense]